MLSFPSIIKMVKATYCGDSNMVYCPACIYQVLPSLLLGHVRDDILYLEHTLSFTGQARIRYLSLIRSTSLREMCLAPGIIAAAGQAPSYRGKGNAVLQSTPLALFSRPRGWKR